MSSSNPFRIVGLAAEEEEQRTRIARIAEMGDVRSLLELLPFLPPGTHRLGVEAAKAAESVLTRSTPTQLAWFDQWYRSGWPPKGPPAPEWKGMQLGGLSWAREFRGVVALASCHPNGFVREVAVRVLSEFDDGFELPFLLIRTNDWVEKVRVAAAGAASRRVGAAYVDHWLRCLGLLERLRLAQRRERGAALYAQRVDELLLGDNVRPRLESALTTGELSIRRGALRLALLLARGKSSSLLKVALRDANPLLAFEAAEGLLRNATHADTTPIISRLLGHRLGRVRKLALLASVEQQLPSAKPWLERAIFDDTRVVREIARHELSKLDAAPRDFAAVYRHRLAEDGHHDDAIALEGLAEVGTRDDAARFLESLHDANARVRAAAIAGVGRCGAGDYNDELEAALHDPSSMVRRAAVPFVRRYLGRALTRRTLRQRWVTG